MRLSHKQQRSAFTLVELLVVMTIIVVILALTIGAIGKSFGWVKQKNTEQTMTKVIQRLQRTIDRIYKEADDWPAATESRMYDQANGSFERARVIKLLYLYKWNFPNTYAEAFHNVQESRLLYDASTGYPPARAILAKLRSNFSVIPDPFANVPTFAWTLGTPTSAANIALDIPWQSSACLMAAFTFANGSPDEFTNNEVIVAPLPVGVAGINADGNPKLVDGWGTPLLFLRSGNFIYSRHRFGGGALPRPAWTMGMVRPASIGNLLDFAPLEFILNPSSNQPPSDGNITSYYFTQLQNRASTAYGKLSGTDPFDPTTLLKNNNQWRSASASTGDWLDPATCIWLSPTPPPSGGTQHATFFRGIFGYMPETGASSINGVTINNQAFCPMVILSAGGDKLFTTWDDNLDSYRLQINVSGQQ